LKLLDRHGGIVESCRDARGWRRRSRVAGGNNPIGYNGAFAIFPDYQTGYDAMVDNLMTGRYQALTIGGAIATWAPAAGGNDPATYANNVQNWTGLPANTPMNTLTRDQIQAVAGAIQRQGRSG
jgi:hypothetical protein